MVNKIIFHQSYDNFLFHGLVLEITGNSENNFYEFKDFFTIKKFFDFFLIVRGCPKKPTTSSQEKGGLGGMYETKKKNWRVNIEIF